MSSSLLKLVAQRLALGVLLLLAVSVLIFAGTQILPGDVATAILGQSATPESLANLRERARPRPTRPMAATSTGSAASCTGDLGTALSSGADIAKSIGARLGTRCSSPAAPPSSPCRWRSCSA